MHWTFYRATMKSVVIITVLYLGVAAGLRKTPLNMAGVVGSNLVLTCNGSTTDQSILWFRTNPIVPTTLLPVTGTRFATQFTDDQYKTSTLTISNLMTTDAGTYACRSGTNINDIAYAQVVVLASAPSCSANATLSNLVNGDIVQVSCTVQVFSATQYQPMFEVSIMGVGTQTAQTVTTGNTMTTSFTEEVQCGYTGRLFRFDLFFPVFSPSFSPDSSWNHAINAASYGYRYTFSPESVTCLMSVIMVSPIKTIYDSGDTLVCAANKGATLPIIMRWQLEQTFINSDSLTIPNEYAGQTVTATCTAVQNSNGRSNSLMTVRKLTIRSQVSGSQPLELGLQLVTAVIITHLLVQS